DYAGLFGIGRDNPDVLPPYVELVKLDGVRHLEYDALLDKARELVRLHLSRRPTTNPVQRFRKRLETDIDWLRADGIDTFHQYAFATLRQFGSSVELAGSL